MNISPTPFTMIGASLLGTVRYFYLKVTLYMLNLLSKVVSTWTFVSVDSCYVVRIGTTQNNQRLFLEVLASLGPGLSLTH